jgi:hypothetical protein
MQFSTPAQRLFSEPYSGAIKEELALLACLQKLRKRLEEDHVGCDEAVATNAKAAADAPDVMQAMMLL